MSRLAAVLAFACLLSCVCIGPYTVLAGNSPVERDLSSSPPDIRWRHSGRQGGDPSPEYFGRELAAGDFNHDGLTDLAVAADYDSRPSDTSFARGAIYIYFGHGQPYPVLLDPAERQADCVISGSAPFAYLGIELAVGDFDGDGITDLAIAENELSTVYRGSIFVVSGQTIGTDPDIRLDEGEYITRLRGRTTGGQAGHYLYFGFSLAAGDFNADGIDDIAGGAIGGDGLNGERPESGEIAVFLGRQTWEPEILAAPGSADMFIVGKTAYDHIGAELGAGDIDGDGRDELVASAWGADGPTDDRPFAGDVAILSFGVGARVPLPTTAGAGGVTWDLANIAASGTVFGPAINARIGSSASDGGGKQLIVGDVDGDGLNDLVIGTPFLGIPYPNGKDPGAVFIVWGDPNITQQARIDLAPEGSDPNASSLLCTGTNGDSLGDSVRVHDLNGDGRAEVIVGAPDANDALGYVAIYGGRSRPATPQPGQPIAQQPDAIVTGEMPVWRAGDDIVVLDATFAGEAMLAIGLPYGGRLPLGGRGYAGEVVAVHIAPLITNLPRVPSIDIQASVVITPNTTVALPIDISPGVGVITSVSSPNLPSFGQLQTIDPAAGLYLLSLSPSGADRGALSITIVATDSGGQSASKRVDVNVGYRPHVNSATVKAGAKFKLTIVGTGFANGEAQVFVDGVQVTPVKYQAKFSTDGGITLTRLVVKSSQLEALIEPGQTSFITIVNPRENLVSDTFAVTR